MPRDTFHNLPDEKRERVIRAAIAEFASHDYADANLDRISGAASVPKGSLYQYFHDKDDCYRYTVATALERAAALFELSLSRRRPRDCFDLFRRSLLFVADLRDSERDLALIYARAGFLSEQGPAGAALPKILELAGTFHERFLAWGIADGLIDSSVDPEAAAFLVDALSTRFHSRLLLGDPQHGLRAANRRRINPFARNLTELLRKALAP
jgi:AcrR family transcriptional regulator